MSFLDQSFGILDQSFFQKLNSRNFFRGLFLRLEREKLDDVIDIEFLDAALSHDETNMPGFIICVKGVDDGGFSVEVIFAEGAVLHNGTKLFEG